MYQSFKISSGTGWPASTISAQKLSFHSWDKKGKGEDIEDEYWSFTRWYG